MAFPFDDDNEFCPDLAVIPADAVAENRSAYTPDLIECVAEVVSRSSIRRDYEYNPRWYASRGIANYLIYRGRDTLAYGPDVTVDSPLGKLTIPTTHLPVDPKAPHRS
ncbi:hypothetical protein SSP24_24320 [Streptomyces spinoverrucosus]|uniref:Putative restriction endonuclease domain-containing protein n=1 Tax=Streptomyces spinoverrucosus TaxID=284043 RepID=A0A4Y3VCW5_9ACTN|nr:Uma2 family endonuclease [Streptomyces spinoverrucosus]GEC04777.1 hypothetical protein SSP24_24320 [Streptomyces spinoverrucosus]GHB59604.1 hypothetical protein GCM10010397_32160 [Streptomyces spinoverrucosus]